MRIQEDAGRSLARQFVQPLVSVIVPCRNEGKWIAPCLDSILANDYPRERLEVLVVDGMSSDETRSVIERYAASHTCIRLLDNAKQITPVALNIGIRRGPRRGDHENGCPC